MPTTAQDLLSTRVVVVHPEQRLSDAAAALRLTHAQYCAVINEESGACEGLVPLALALSYSSPAHRIFADLADETPWPRISEDTAAESTLSALGSDPGNALIVQKSDGRYAGIVTMESAWGWLVQSQARQQRLLERVYEDQRKLSDFLEKKVEQRTASLRQALDEFRTSSIHLSHDVGSPLRTIKSFVEMLTSGECGTLNDEGRAYVNRIVRAATKVETLAAEILGRSREAAKFAPSAQHAVDLNEIVADSIELSRALLDGRNAAIRQRDALHSVSGRYVPLLQIITNLLANAVKYVPPGRRPEVEIWTEASADRVRLHIKDNGRGIRPADAESVFEPFVRLDDEHTEGTGLGLSIARDATQALGGRITLDSTEDVGSVFTVEFKSASGG